MEKIPITAKGVITLPFVLRKKFGVLDGGMVLLEEQEDGLLLKKLAPEFFEPFLGKYAGELPTSAEILAWSNEEITTDEARIKALP